MCYSIKVKLTTTETEYYKSVSERVPDLTATNIHIANISGSAATVSLSFTRTDGVFDNGVILSSYSIPANSYLELSERRLNQDQTIRAFAGVNDAIVISIDILGDEGEYFEAV